MPWRPLRRLALRPQLIFVGPTTMASYGLVATSERLHRQRSSNIVLLPCRVVWATAPGAFTWKSWETPFIAWESLIAVAETASWRPGILSLRCKPSTRRSQAVRTIPISVKVAAGTQQGHLLRVRGKGLPEGGVKRGDLYVEVSLQVPNRVSKEAERLWKELASESKFDPRKTA